MTATPSRESQSIRYPRRTIERAERAMRCSPFQLNLFTTMRSKSVPLLTIAGDMGVQHQYTHHQLSELATDNALLWLIQVGVLRREVDGQGITDSFRLTPLGRQLVEKWQPSGVLPTPSLLERFQNAVNHWLRLPI